MRELCRSHVLDQCTTKVLFCGHLARVAIESVRLWTVEKRLQLQERGSTVISATGKYGSGRSSSQQSAVSSQQSAVSSQQSAVA